MRGHVDQTGSCKQINPVVIERPGQGPEPVAREDRRSNDADGVRVQPPRDIEHRVNSGAPTQAMEIGFWIDPDLGSDRDVLD
jgi:hypothetical protein